MAIYKHPYKHTKNGHPSLVELELTSGCNANCIFCPRHLYKHPRMLDKTVFDQILLRLTEAYVKYVKLAGIGEPTLHPELLKLMCQLHNQEFHILLNTNGSLLHHWNIDEILSYCNEIIISFHSANHYIHKKIFGVDFYNQVLLNIGNLLKINENYKRNITLYVVITSLNHNAIDEIKKHFGSSVNIRVSGCTNRTLEDFVRDISDNNLSSQYNHYPTITPYSNICGFAEAALSIDSQGRYLLCTNDVKRNNGLNNVWGISVSDVFSKIRRGFKEGRFIEFCRKCDNFANL